MDRRRNLGSDARAGAADGRNLDRDWHQLAAADPVVRRPALMIYGDRDAILRSERLAEFVWVHTSTCSGSSTSARSACWVCSP
ncbi:hypothetical protein ACQP00_35695 [Dactylosporangium sp. CS-047395]|uniref:hypothetical protein n=1 Tax=Dactylosporangium sp. CS-047395 TaxID=3239936 RepID=UPI003D8DC880